MKDSFYNKMEINVKLFAGKGWPPQTLSTHHLSVFYQRWQHKNIKTQNSLFAQICLWSQNISHFRLVAPWVCGLVLELYRSFQWKSLKEISSEIKKKKLNWTLKDCQLTFFSRQFRFWPACSFQDVHPIRISSNQLKQDHLRWM